MKRYLCIVLAALMLLVFCACSKTSAESGTQVTLTFLYGEQNIHAVLPADEASKVIRILDGNTYDPVSAGVPSCGFDPDISIQVGSRVFAIACDTCNTVQDLGNLRFFSVTQEEIEYIHALFETYGGFFPCV